MKILFDQGVPKPLLKYLPDHEIHRAFKLGWAEKRNGELLALAEAEGFQMLVTTDQQLFHQQNLRAIKLALFILGRGNWPDIEPYALKISARISNIHEPGVYLFDIDPSG